MPQRNLAVELLQKLLKGELATRRRKNVVQARSFADMLEQTLRRYQNRAIEAAQVIEELISLAREMREANARGEQLGLTEDELAFYDALETNDSAVQVLGDETLRDIARELVETVRGNVTIDWTLRENVRANLRRLVRRILRKHGYPPDKQEKATRTVLEQAEALSAGWAAWNPRCRQAHRRNCNERRRVWRASFQGSPLPCNAGSGPREASSRIAEASVFQRPPDRALIQPLVADDHQPRAPVLALAPITVEVVLNSLAHR